MFRLTRYIVIAQWASAAFSVEKMVDDYITVYRKILTS